MNFSYRRRRGVPGAGFRSALEELFAIVLARPLVRQKPRGCHPAMKVCGAMSIVFSAEPPAVISTEGRNPEASVHSRPGNALAKGRARDSFARQPRAGMTTAPVPYTPSLSVILIRRRRISAKRLVRTAMGALKILRKNRSPASGCRRPVGRREASSLCANKSQSSTPSRQFTGPLARSRIVTASNARESSKHHSRPKLFSEERVRATRASCSQKYVAESNQDPHQRPHREVWLMVV